MKKVTESDIEFLKTICFVFKKELFNNPNVKEENWKDKINTSVANVFNFEQRLIDLITSEIKKDESVTGLSMPKLTSEK